MDIIKFAEEIKKNNIDLGTNPIRTIRYYINMGILQKSQITQLGKKRISDFNEDHIIQLKIVNDLKKQGLSLDEIKDKMNQMIYWSDLALNIIEKYRKEIPDDAFQKNKPITREEMAFFLDRFILGDDTLKISIDDMKEYIVDKNGRPIEIPFV